MTDSKRRLTFTRPFEECTFCEKGVTSPIDTLYPSPESCLPFEHFFKLLEAEILNNQSDFLDTAIHHMKGFLKLVEDGHPISGEDAKSLMCGVWLNPCFLHSLATAIDYRNDDMISSVMYYSNQDSVADRTAHMEADPYFKLSVMGLKEPTSTRKARAIERAGKEDKIEDFFCVIEDLSHAKDMEPLRKLMVGRYAKRGDLDIEVLLEKIKYDLSNLLSIIQNYLGYDGKKTEIYGLVMNGSHSALTMKALPTGGRGEAEGHCGAQDQAGCGAEDACGVGGRRVFSRPRGALFSRFVISK